MMNEPLVQGALFMADEMLAAGVAELKAYDPNTDKATETVARIYTAMEVVRVMIEHMLEHERGNELITPEERAKKLN